MDKQGQTAPQDASANGALLSDTLPGAAAVRRLADDVASRNPFMALPPGLTGTDIMVLHELAVQVVQDRPLLASESGIATTLELQTWLNIASGYPRRSADARRAALLRLASSAFQLIAIEDLRVTGMIYRGALR